MTYQGRSKFMPTGEEAKTRKRAWTSYALHVIVTAILSHSVGAKITPSDDAYTLTSSPSTNFGAKNTMLVESSGATSFYPLRPLRNPFVGHRLHGRQLDAEDFCCNGADGRIVQCRSGYQFVDGENHHRRQFAHFGRRHRQCADYPERRCVHTDQFSEYQLWRPQHHAGRK
jgi:hypothetical protein